MFSALRYIAVTRPIQYAKHKNSKRVYVMLALTWVISIGISSPIALGMNYTDGRRQTPTMCTFYNSDFLIYSSMGSFYIPCVVMVLLYWRIFHAIRVRARKSAIASSAHLQHRLQQQARRRRSSSANNGGPEVTSPTTAQTAATEDGREPAEVESQRPLMRLMSTESTASVRAKRMRTGGSGIQRTGLDLTSG